MGIARPKDLDDLRKLEADLKVTCVRCGRAAIFPILPILNHFRSRGWNTAWDTIGRHFACRGKEGDRGCGSREVRLSLAPPDRIPPPKPIVTNRAIKERIRRERG